MPRTARLEGHVGQHIALARTTRRPSQMCGYLPLVVAPVTSPRRRGPPRRGRNRRTPDIADVLDHHKPFPAPGRAAGTLGDHRASSAHGPGVDWTAGSHRRDPRRRCRRRSPSITRRPCAATSPRCVGIFFFPPGELRDSTRSSPSARPLAIGSRDAVVLVSSRLRPHRAHATRPRRRSFGKITPVTHPLALPPVEGHHPQRFRAPLDPDRPRPLTASAPPLLESCHSSDTGRRGSFDHQLARAPPLLSTVPAEATPPRRRRGGPTPRPRVTVAPLDRARST